MIRFLIDSSGLWRVLRDSVLRASWGDVIASGAVGSCDPQRAEFRASARNRTEFDQMNSMFDELYPDVAVQKSVWRWIESTQYTLSAKGKHKGLSLVDLLVTAVAVHHGLTILHDDKDFVTIRKEVAEVRERNIHHSP